MAEAFGRSIQAALNDGMIKGIKVTEGIENVTHQQFADDTMLFGKSSLAEAKQFKEIMLNYTRALGLEVNMHKSEIYIINTSEVEAKKICRLIRFKKGMFPCKYLGLSMDRGVRVNRLWEPVKEKIKQRVSSWKGKWLSNVGRATMIKALLSSIPIYQLSCLPLAQGAKDKIEKLLKKFYCQGPNDQKKLVTISWDKICKPREMGGVGTKNMDWQGKALGAKLVWTLYQNPKKKWARILQHKYLSNGDPSCIFRTPCPPQGSRIWNFMMNCKQLILDRLTWDVANGNKARFWGDSWGGYVALDKMNLSPIIKEVLTNPWGTQIKDYIKISSEGPAWG
ncbi:hypothetical protein SUGI_0238400 [Cryptomeria japonica]|nr:hypothetical protein SUGI_0238400 [Cryptomeria japonica]